MSSLHLEPHQPTSIDDIQRCLRYLKAQDIVSSDWVVWLLSQDLILNWVLPLGDDSLRKDFEFVILTKFQQKDFLFTHLFQHLKESRYADELSAYNQWKQNSYTAVLLQLLKTLIFSQLDLFIFSISHHDLSQVHHYCTRLVSVPDIALKAGGASTPSVLQPLFVRYFG